MEKGPERRETLSGPYVCFLIFFSPFYCSPHPSLARTMPTKAHEGPQKPTQAHEDGKRAQTTRDVVWALGVFFQFFFSPFCCSPHPSLAQMTPMQAHEGPQKTMQAHRDRKRARTTRLASFGPQVCF